MRIADRLSFFMTLLQSFVRRHLFFLFFFFSSRRRHTRSLCDWSSDVCSSDLDVDVMYRELAGRLGVRFERTTSLNDDPLLVGALAEIARATAAARGWT